MNIFKWLKCKLKSSKKDLTSLFSNQKNFNLKYFVGS